MRIITCLLLAAALPLSMAHAGAPASAASASAQAQAGAKAPPANTLRVHYKRSNGDENTWGVYAWEGPQQPSKKWIADRFLFSKAGPWGHYVDIPLAPGKTEFRFLVSSEGGHKNCGDDQFLPLAADIAKRGQQIWIPQASCTIHEQQPE